MTHTSPRHRAGPSRARHTIVVAAVGGLLLTGGTVSASAVLDGSADRAAASAASSSADQPAVASDSTGGVSRGAEREPLDASAAADLLQKAAKAKAAEEKRTKVAERKRRALADAREDPRGVARDLLAEQGWDASQFSCLDALWAGESGWDYRATNPSSGAYGIPQSLPATKMATAGDDWETNPTTQIRWGLDYIAAAYGTPCSANAFKAGNGFY